MSKSTVLEGGDEADLGISPVAYTLLDLLACAPEAGRGGSTLLLRTPRAVSLKPDVPQLVPLGLRLYLPRCCAGFITLALPWGLHGLRILDSFLEQDLVDGPRGEGEAYLTLVWSPLATGGDSGTFVIPPRTRIANVHLAKSHVLSVPPLEIQQRPSHVFPVPPPETQQKPKERVRDGDPSAAPEGAAPPAPPRSWWRRLFAT